MKGYAPNTRGFITGAAGASGPAVNGGGSNCLIYRPGSAEVGPVVFGDWGDLITQLTALRAAANDGGCYVIQFDDSITSPANIPSGGPYDMTDVTWEGNVASDGCYVQISDGASFTGLRKFRGYLYVENRNLTTSPCTDLVSGDIVELHDYSELYTVGGGVAFYTTNFDEGDYISVHLHEFSSLASTDVGPVFMMDADIYIITTDSAYYFENAIHGGGNIYQFYSSARRIAATFPSFAGTVNAAFNSVPASLTESPYLAAPATAEIASPEHGMWLRLDSSGAAITQTLPAIANAFYEWKNPGTFLLVTASADSTITIVEPAVGDTIEGLTNISLLPGSSVLLISDGISQWSIVSKWGDYQSVQGGMAPLLPPKWAAPGNTALAPNNAKAAFVGYAPRDIEAGENITVRWGCSVGGAGYSTTWAELAIATGAPQFGSNPTLTVVGYVSAQAFMQTPINPGNLVVPISAGRRIRSGEGIWTVAATLGGLSPTVATCLADDLGTGYSATNTTASWRPSSNVGIDTVWTVGSILDTQLRTAVLLP